LLKSATHSGVGAAESRKGNFLECALEPSRTWACSGLAIIVMAWKSMGIRFLLLAPVFHLSWTQPVGRTAHLEYLNLSSTARLKGLQRFNDYSMRPFTTSNVTCFSIGLYCGLSP